MKYHFLKPVSQNKVFGYLSQISIAYYVEVMVWELYSESNLGSLQKFDVFCSFTYEMYLPHIAENYLNKLFKIDYSV